MLTKSNCEVTIISRDAIGVGGHEISASWDANGCLVSRSELKALCQNNLANWSDEEIGDIAYFGECELEKAFAKHYEIGLWDGYNKDVWVSLEHICVANNDAANAYAEAEYVGKEWVVLDASGQNING